MMAGVLGMRGSERRSWEIACDESGSEGERLVGGTTDVFAHASVDIEVEAANVCIAELRTRTRSPATEYKASVVLREQNRAALIWLLGPSGPVLGGAHVHLTEKSYLLASSLVAFLANADPTQTHDGNDRAREPQLCSAAALHREAVRATDEEAPMRLFASFNDLMRAKESAEVVGLAETFFELGDRLLTTQTNGFAVDLARFWPASVDRRRLVRRVLDPSRMSPRLDPLVAAVVAAAEHWAAAGRDFSFVHDQHYLLTPGLIAYLEGLIRARTASARTHDDAGRYTGMRLVDSQHDPRVQIADLVAGSARRIASDALHGVVDDELVALLRPYVDRHSWWGDAGTASLLGIASADGR